MEEVSPFPAEQPPSPPHLNKSSLLFLLPNFSRTKSAAAPDHSGKLWQPDGGRHHLHRIFSPGAGEHPQQVEEMQDARVEPRAQSV